MPQLGLSLPQFGELPKDQKLESARPKAETAPLQAIGVDERYTVTSVFHAKYFLPGPVGARTTGASLLSQISIGTSPYATEKFSTVVRVKSLARRNGRIDVAVLDSKGDTVMEASGELRFGKTDETEWQVDWEPSGVKNADDLQVLVRVAGSPAGTFPLKVARGEQSPTK